ncbi:Mitochondrial import inner membrane translocase subunit TIM44 [Tritrichomonas musculus]|uniref:Mitochondrial import inner membrane translocase subunit TIM44 n=1 Tax=Tritrichomonas musculus TaxID=1915356 RepID=A0ABR2JZ39_9EUKA
MALVSAYPNLKFGSRSASMFDTLGETLGQNFSEDSDVQKWVIELKRDPSIQLLNATTKGTGFYITTALKMTNSIFNFATLPITYPLSKVLKEPEFKLAPCPFPAARITKVKGNGDLAIRKNNSFENAILNLKNFSYKAELSKNFLLRYLFKLGYLICSLPSRLQLTEPTKECLVMLAIQRYFPSYNEAKFLKWLESSFLPCLTHYYIRGMSKSLQTVAETAIVQERQMQISEYVISGLLVKSRLLSIYDVEIVDYDFKGHHPIITVRYSADHTEHVVTRKGVTLIGGPQSIKKSMFLALITINETGIEPVWKATEIHIGQVSDRI